MRSGGQEAQERPGDVGQADTKLPRPGACAAEGTPLRQVKPLQHRVSGCRLRSKGALTTLRCEDAVVGSGRRGEREHESRDAPAERAEVVPLESMGALLRARVCAQEAAEARLAGPTRASSRHASTLGSEAATSLG